MHNAYHTSQWYTTKVTTLTAPDHQLPENHTHLGSMPPLDGSIDRVKGRKDLDRTGPGHQSAWKTAPSSVNVGVGVALKRVSLDLFSREIKQTRGTRRSTPSTLTADELLLLPLASCCSRSLSHPIPSQALP